MEIELIPVLELMRIQAGKKYQLSFPVNTQGLDNVIFDFSMP